MLNKKIRLSKSQLDKMSDLSIGLGLWVFGSTVLPFVIPKLDRPRMDVLLFGVTIAVILWIFAIWIVRKN